MTAFISHTTIDCRNAFELSEWWKAVLQYVDELTKAGRDVPGDVSVAGFDGIEAALAAALTTIGQPIADKGHRAVQLLLDTGATERQVFLPSELIVGRTTGPAPRA